MPPPSTLAQWLGFLLFAGFFGVIFWKLAAGGIPLDQLLEKKSHPPQDAGENAAGSSSLSAGRAQSLAVTLFVAFYYLVHVIHNPQEFPEIPGMLVALLAGSQALYLSGKALDMLPDSWLNFLR